MKPFFRSSLFEEFGEAICAVVQPAQGASIAVNEVKEYLRGRVSSYKIPKIIEFRQEMPRQYSGKIYKRKLREPYWTGIDRRI